MRKILKRLSVLICGCLVAVCALSTFAGSKDNVSTPVRDVELVEQNIDFNTFIIVLKMRVLMLIKTSQILKVIKR